MTNAPPIRLVALGASNLVGMVPSLAASVCRATGGPVEVLSASGHGRSYGQWSTVAGIRALPGIARCGLWRALAADPHRPTLAMVTDIGNDVAYGVPVTQILAWVDACLDRLASIEARVVVTLPPVAVLARTPAWQLRAVLRVFFPGRDGDSATILRQVETLAQGVNDRATARGMAVISPAPSWYGIDPIHLHARGRRAQQAAMLRAWGLRRTPGRTGLGAWLAVRSAPAANVRWFGRRFTRVQPCRRWRDGTSFGLF